MPPLFLSPFVTFTFVLAQVSGLIMTAPLFGSSDVPTRVRALLAFALALLVTPLQLSVRLMPPANLPLYLIGIGGELLVGMMLGLGVMVLLSGVQVAGQIISQ